MLMLAVLLARYLIIVTIFNDLSNSIIRQWSKILLKFDERKRETVHKTYDKMRPKSRSTVLLVNFRGILCNVIDSKDIPTLWCCSLSCFNSAYSCSCCLGSFWFFVFNTSLFIVILFSSIYCQKNGFSETVSLFLFLFGNGFDASFGVFV